MGQGDQAGWRRGVAGALFVAAALTALEVSFYLVGYVGPIWAVRAAVAVLVLAYAAVIGGSRVLPWLIVMTASIQALQLPHVRSQLAEVNWERLAALAVVFIRDIYIAIFVVLTVYGVRHWRRTRLRAGLWLTGAFLVLAVVTVTMLVTGSFAANPDWLRRSLVSVLALYPFLIYGFTASFGGHPRWLWWGAAALTAGLVGWTLMLPAGLLAEGAYVAYSLSFIAVWALFSLIATIYLWRSGRNQSWPAKVRMRLLGAAVGSLSGAIIISGSGLDSPMPSLAAQIMVLLSSLGFYFGYSTPGWLKRALRKGYQGRRHQLATEAFIKATNRGEIYRRFVALATEALGAARVTLFSTSGDVVVGGGEETEEFLPRTMELQFDFGRIVVEASPYAPFFGDADFEYVNSLSALVSVAIERVQTEKKYRNMFEHSAIGLFQTSPEGKLLVANPALVKICGFDNPEEMIGALNSVDQQIYVQPGRRQEFVEKMRSEGKVKSFESEIYRKDGSRIWVSETAQAVYDLPGNLMFYEGTVEDITDRKAAQEELKRETEFTEGLIHNSTDGILAFDGERRYTVWNPAMEIMTGKKADEVLGKVSDEVFPFLKEQGIIDKYYAAALRGEKTGTARIRYDVAETGRKGVSEAHYLPVFGSGGRIVGGMAMVRDITAELEAQEQLELRNQYLASLHEVTLDLMGELETEQLIMAVVEKAGQLLDAPNAYVYMLDSSSETMSVRVGLGVFKDYIGFKLGRGEGMAGKVWESGQAMLVDDYDSWPERSPAFPSGVFHAVAGAPLKFGGQVVGVIGLAHLDPSRSFSRDQIDLLAQFAELASIRLERARLYEDLRRELEQRRKVEQAVRESEEKFRSVAATASDGIVTFSEEGQIVYLNPAAERLFGYGTEAVGRPLKVLFPDHYFNPELTGSAVELTGCHKEKGEFPIEVTLAKWKSGDSEKGRDFFTLIVRDISERKRIDQAKRDFVSLVSHQLKTPVALIRGYTDNLLSGVLGDMPERQRQYLHDIQEISAKNYNLITDLLNASRLERGVISFVPKLSSLGDIVRQASRPHAQRIADKGLELIMEGDDSVQVRLDIFKTAEAIGNAIDNALKFTPEGFIRLAWGQAKGRAFVEISDSGPGMSKEIRQRLFRRDEPFSSDLVPEPGAGLGLYIAREFIMRQGGEIEVESRSGKGSKFTFRLPLVKVKTKGGR